MDLNDLKFYQWAIVLISATMIYFGLEKYLRHEAHQTLFKLIGRLLIWGGMAAVALFPEFTNYLAGFIGIIDNMNAVILTGFLLTFLFIFKILSVVERIEQNISTLTRKEALKDFENRELHSSKKNITP